MSHVLVPAFCLLGRLDAVEVIGEALTAGVEGGSDEVVGAAVGVPSATVRGWRRRHRGRAETLVAGVAAVIVALVGVAPRLSGEPERASVALPGDQPKCGLKKPGTIALSQTHLRTTIPSSAQPNPRRDNFARSSAARVVSWRHTCPHPAQR
jgi:hypothetical protein